LCCVRAPGTIYARGQLVEGLVEQGGEESMKISFERPEVMDFGSISAHTFMPTPPNPQGRGGGGHKGFVNCRVETTNCELSHAEDGGGGGSP
jgi:hypothetical protein